MSAVRWWAACCVLVLPATLVLSGCNGGADDVSPAVSSEADDHDHDGHDHDHDHDHDGHDHDGHDHDDHHLGPHGGHFATLQPGDLKAEWVILNEGKELQVILPEDAEQVEAVEMHVQVGDDQLDPYAFEKAEDLGEGAWRLSDPALFSHVKMTADHEAGVKVEIVALTGEEAAKAEISHHEH
ncbi:hypothetical protein [Roseimaritima sediminicola]|uniref:hypothetical protein n=1 Tax=Roseimaritima sediminicola TaxID=2662066 RepID=UPI0012984A18|nr:hypothetical protein [Roseimaritima sediminicola]